MTAHPLTLTAEQVRAVLDTTGLTPFERMKVYVENAGYTLKHVVGDEGTEGYLYDTLPRGGEITRTVETALKHEVVFYFGAPTGKEWYWTLDGKIAVENAACFDKWSRVPFFVWLPETDDEAERIIKAIKFIGTPKGYKKSNEFEIVNEMFGFDIPKRKVTP